jgi:hypothetical protein
MHRGQKGTNKHDQQIDFHDFLRCTAAASTSKRMECKERSTRSNDSGVIKNGKFEVTAW